MCVEKKYLCGLLGDFIKQVPAPAPPGHLDWGRLEQVAGRNLVMPIVCHMTQNFPLPEAVGRRWKNHQIGIELFHARAHAATTWLCEALEQAGIPVVVMRGMALAQGRYPSPSLRPMVDVDLLVPPAARFALPAFFRDHGLNPVKMLRSQFVCQVNGVVFEIHWSFLTPKRYRQAVDANLWLGDRRPLPAWGGKVFGLAPEHELVALVCHAFIHHELDTLLSLVDIGLVSQGDNLNWRAIWTWCSQASLSRLFWFTLALVEWLFHLGLPETIVQAGLPWADFPTRRLQAYEAPLLATDTRADLFHRQLHLLQVAETPAIKFRQVLRLFNMDQLGRLVSFKPGAS